MRVLDRSVYRGPHAFGRLPMIRFALDLEDLAGTPTDELPGFADALVAALPGLRRHGCSRGRPGGFVERMHEGTWMGHVVEHVALELQSLAGHPLSRGKTRAQKLRTGVFDVLYAYESPPVALAAGRLSLELVGGILDLSLSGLDRLALALPATAGEAVPGLAALTELARKHSLGPTTRSIVDEARRRGIPVERVDDLSLVRLGWGSRQRTVRASITGATSHLGVLAAGDKRVTKRMLEAAAIPVPRGTVVTTADEAVLFAASLGTAVVTKPVNGNHGRGISTGLVGEREVRDGFAAASRISREVIVEQHLPGRDHRVLVIGGAVVAVAERVAAEVVGDGVSTIGELIANLNSDPRRGEGHEKVMTRVHLDAPLTALLHASGLSLDSVPASGHVVVLRQTANLSTGGEAIDRTDELHPSVRSIAERSAAIVGLDIVGIDLITSDIGRPLAETGGGIVEVNAAPGFRMHLQPSAGRPRDVAGAVIDLLYPPRTRSRIPVISVTGTNGKSTTVLMIAHILARAGAGRLGVTTTSAVTIDGHVVRSGDSSGPKSARLVLGDPTVDAAVLETARGGILREGLAYDRADVGVVLNVSADHLGLKGVDTLQGLARVKSVVARRVSGRGTTVLNADDRLTRPMAQVAGGRLAFFTEKSLDQLDEQLLSQGALLATLERSRVITLHDGGERIELIDAADIPATMGGAARFNIANAQAAALAAYARGFSPAVIAAALASFESTFEQNPGRLNITRAPGFTTMVDYAHNPAALRALGELIAAMRFDHDRVIGVVSTPGDRRDDDIRELGRLSALIFDDVVFRELPDGRGRPAGGVVGLLSEAAEAAGMAPERIRRVMDEREAMDAALGLAGPRDLVVLTVSNVSGVWAQATSFRPAWATVDA